MNIRLMIIPFRYTPITRGIAFYYHNDHLNTPMKVSDEKGDIVWEVVSPHPFGEFEIESREVKISDYTGSSSDDITYRVSNPLRFPGQYDDSDTKDIRSLILSNANGLYYNWNRWYNPDTGRYMEVDSYQPLYLSGKNFRCRNLFNEKTKHRFIYSNNNPTIYYDLSGLDCMLVDACLRGFALFGNENIRDAENAILEWHCDWDGKGCKGGKLKCCGYAEPGSLVITITNVLDPPCNNQTCITVLHEIFHAVVGSENDYEAEVWAQSNVPECCRF